MSIKGKEPPFFLLSDRGNQHCHMTDNSAQLSVLGNSYIVYTEIYVYIHCIYACTYAYIYIAYMCLHTVHVYIYIYEIIHTDVHVHRCKLFPSSPETIKNKMTTRAERGRFGRARAEPQPRSTAPHSATAGLGAAVEGRSREMRRSVRPPRDSSPEKAPSDCKARHLLPSTSGRSCLILPQLAADTWVCFLFLFFFFSSFLNPLIL